MKSTPPKRGVDGSFPMSVPLASIEAGHRHKSAPGGVGAPDARGLADRKDTDRLMETVLPRADNAPDEPLAFDRDAALTKIDGCPECVTNYEPPRDVARGASGFIASYLCTDCGHAWITSWSAS